MRNTLKAIEISEQPAHYDADFDKETTIRLQRYNAAMLMAEWKDCQLKSKWHDSEKEQPDKNRRIIVINAINYLGEVGVFSEVYPNHLWAYLSDLLPMEEGE